MESNDVVNVNSSASVQSCNQHDKLRLCGESALNLRCATSNFIASPKVEGSEGGDIHTTLILKYL